MSELSKRKLSRRKLLGGAAGTAAALPLLHEFVPHQGVHDQLASAQGDAHGGKHGKATAATEGSNHRGAVGRVDPRANGFDPTAMLRDYDRGVVRREGGRTIREFELVAEDKEIEVAPGVKYAAWTYNGRVPGPALRATEGERVRVRFVNGSKHPHTIHFHGIHLDLSDGVPGVGRGNVESGGSFTYEFDAVPFGLHPLPLPHDPAQADHIREGARMYGASSSTPQEEAGPRADEKPW